MVIISCSYFYSSLFCISKLAPIYDSLFSILFYYFDVDNE